MTEKTAFEKYLAGEPLTEELSQMRDGRAPDAWPTPEAWNAMAPAVPEGDKPLTAAQRELLREAKANGVLATLIQCAKRALHKHIVSATIDSENDPLARSAEISRQWAYVAMYRRAALELEQLINAEIRELEGEQIARLLDRDEAERATR